MKLLSLTIHQHDASLTGDKVHIEMDYITAIREYTYPKTSFTEITTITGDKYEVKETFAEIEETVRKGKKWL